MILPPLVPHRTENVLMVMVDGLRWQEVFRGAETPLLAGVKDEKVRAAFGGDTPDARRRELMPFLWSTVLSQGTILGDRDLGSRCAVTNGRKFSYPGYSETLCGYVDPGIDSNRYRPNPNVTVFEWLARQPGWKGGVGAFGAWNVIGAAFNESRAPFTVNAGYEPLTKGQTTLQIALLNQLKAETPRDWDDEPYDPITFHTTVEWVKANRPRLVYLSLGEPDDWAHAGNYGRYLESTRRWDADVRELWETLQAMPQYRGKTTLILTCDHGRGNGPKWTNHGTDVEGAEATWMAFMGPDTPARGLSNDAVATNDGIAATLARFLGYDYPAAESRAGAPIKAALP